MSSLKVIDSLLNTLILHEPTCIVSLNQHIPFEGELALLLSTLKTRNLYKLNIDQTYSKLQILLANIPIHTKHNLLNKYYSHSWISHVSYLFNRTPLSVFVALLKKYVIRKKFDTLWNIIVLLLEHGAYPLLNPIQNTKQTQILSLRLIWQLFSNLFNFIDDEREILKKISFVLSFVDRFKFRTFSWKDTHSFVHFEVTKHYPSICSHIKVNIPSPLLLNVLLTFGFPMFHSNDALSNICKLHRLSFAMFHKIFFTQKSTEFQLVYTQLQKDTKYPRLVEGMCDIIMGMAYGDRMVHKYRNKMYIESDTKDSSDYLYHLFGLNSAWIKWTFTHVWQCKTDTQLSDLCSVLSQNNLYLSEWSGRVRESSNNFSAEFVKFYIKNTQLQTRFNGKELVFWMQKYANNSEIMQLLFKTKYLMNREFVNNALFQYFWNVLCTQDRNSIVLRLLNKHLIDKCVFDLDNFEKCLCLPLFDRFCDRFNGLFWRVKSNLMKNMTELLQKWKLNELEIVNTYYGLKCVFNGASIAIFKQMTESNLLNVKETENNIFDIFAERGKYIQTRHQKMMIHIGKWLIDHGNKQKLVTFVDGLVSKCERITGNEALQKRQSVMIKRFQQEWHLH